MKKYTVLSFVFILSFILLGSIGVKSANASVTDTGCVNGNLYSTTTGQACTPIVSSTTSASASASAQLQIGSRGSAVKAFQQTLKNAGFLTGKVDGIYGKQTAAAASAYNAYYQKSTTSPAISSIGINPTTPITTPTPSSATAQLSVSPTSISISANNPTATVTVSNTGPSGSTLGWSLAGYPGGVSVSTQNGQLSGGQSTQVTFTYSSAAVSTGSTPDMLYFYPVAYISGTGNNGTPVPVSLTIGSTTTTATNGLIVSKNTAFADQTYSTSSANVKVGSFILTAGNSNSETINVNDIDLDANHSNFIQNLHLVVESSNQAFGAIEPTPVVGDNQFYGSVKIPAGGSVVVDAYADILATATNATVPISAVEVASCQGVGTVSNVIVPCTGAPLLGQNISVGTTTASSSVITPTFVASQSTVAENIVSTGSGAVNASQATFNFVSTGGPSTITEILFATSTGTPNTTSSPYIIKSVTLNGVTVPFNKLIADFTGLNITVPSGGAGINLTFYLSYYPVDTTGTNLGVASGSIANMSIFSMKYLESNGVSGSFTDVNNPALEQTVTTPSMTVVGTTTPTQSVITVTSPSGGEQWAQGSTHAITWTDSIYTASSLYDIYISNPSTPPIPLTTSVPGLSYNWTISSSLAAQQGWDITVCRAGTPLTQNGLLTNCDTGNWFTITSGTTNPTPISSPYPPGCNSATGFSSVDGSPCGAPTVTFTANPTSVSSGGTSTLTWSATETPSCSVSGGSLTPITSGSSSSSYNTGALTSTTTYTVNCSNSLGSSSASATVTVVPTSTPIISRPISGPIKPILPTGCSGNSGYSTVSGLSCSIDQ